MSKLQRNPASLFATLFPGRAICSIRPSRASCIRHAAGAGHSTCKSAGKTPMRALSLLGLSTLMLTLLSAGQRTARAEEGAETKQDVSTGVRTVRPAAGSPMVLNESESTSAAAHLARDGHMVITDTADVWIPNGQAIELQPRIRVSHFKPVALTVYEDGWRVQVIGLEGIPTLPPIWVYPPQGFCNRKRIVLVASDAVGHSQLIMKCTVRARILLPTVTLTTTPRGEMSEVSLSDRETVKAAYLYLGDKLLGSLDASTSKIMLDTRTLNAGTYDYKLLAQNEDGIWLPQVHASFEVAERYRLAPVSGESRFEVPDSRELARFPIKVEHDPALSITRTRVFVAGNFVAELGQPAFTIAVPVYNVPSGPTSIDVIGIAQDGTEYPPETLSVLLENHPFEERITHRAEYFEIADLLPRIAQLEREAGYWWVRTKSEAIFAVNVNTTPDSKDAVWEGRRLTMNSFQRMPVGNNQNAAEYRSNARNAVWQMAYMHLQVARLYRRLNIRAMAANHLRTAIRLSGPTSSIGTTATAELESLFALKKP